MITLAEQYLEEVKETGLQEQLYRIYENQALFKRFILFEIEVEEFVRLTQINCHYCGVEPLQEFHGYIYNGIDRIDNSEGYIEGNVVSCCGHCNTMKGELPKTDFIEHCKHITNFTSGNRTIPKPVHAPNDYYKSVSNRCLDFGEAATNIIFDSYKRRAKKYNRVFDIDMELFIKITQNTCFYCGVEPSNRQSYKTNYGDFIYNGVDRTDSSKGYVEGNIVPCCGRCNTMKTNMDALIFTKQAIKIANYRW